MTTLCALGFVVSLVYAIITCRRSDYNHDGIDWRILLPMVIGGYKWWIVCWWYRHSIFDYIPYFNFIMVSTLYFILFRII